MNTEYIYTLSDPRTKEVRYVGRTSRPVRRSYDHTSRRQSGGANVQAWKTELLDAGIKPVFEIIYEVPERLGYLVEEEVIARCREKGFDLLNDKTTKASRIRRRLKSAEIAKYLGPKL